MGKWESRSDFQGSGAAGFSTTQVATTVYAFCMAGSEVTLYGRFWVTPEAGVGLLDPTVPPKRQGPLLPISAAMLMRIFAAIILVGLLVGIFLLFLPPH